MTFMPPGKDNPIGKAADFKIGGSGTGGSTVDILRGFGNRLQARGLAQGNARAIIESAKIKAATEMTVKQMELQAQAEAQQREHENAIKIVRANNNHTTRLEKLKSEQGRLDQLQSTNNVHGVLDRMITDFPDADLDFKTERGQSIRITRPREASSDSSEGGS
jgi:hypothetical protein